MDEYTWPDPADDGPACTCPQHVFRMNRHPDPECPAAAVEAPRPAWTPGAWTRG